MSKTRFRMAEIFPGIYEALPVKPARPSCSRCDKPTVYAVQAPTPWDIPTCRDHLADAIDDVIATGWAATVMLDARYAS
jgi:hypothetical protein